VELIGGVTLYSRLNGLPTDTSVININANNT